MDRAGGLVINKVTKKDVVAKNHFLYYMVLFGQFNDKLLRIEVPTPLQ